MTGWRRAAAGLLLLGAGAAGAPAHADTQGTAPGRVLFVIDDDEVFESSGLVDIGPVVYTTNDSGDDAVLYGLDSGTGKLVSRTTYADKVEDVEALAPGRDGTVWAGDVGDNRQRRASITAYAVTPRPGRQERPARAYELVYPDGPHNAETLLVSPRDGRLYVVTKSPFGGTVYAAPRRLSPDSPNRLKAFARVRGLVTDGTFLPDGRRVLLRTYGTASAYTFPGFAPIGSVRLPAQPQGEGISVAPDGRVLVSSEGVASQVLQVTLPAAFTAGPADPTASPLPPRAPAAPAADPSASRSATEWGWVALVAVGIGALGYLAVRGSRLRGPHRP